MVAGADAVKASRVLSAKARPLGLERRVEREGDRRRIFGPEDGSYRSDPIRTRGRARSHVRDVDTAEGVHEQRTFAAAHRGLDRRDAAGRTFPGRGEDGADEYTRGAENLCHPDVCVPVRGRRYPCVLTEKPPGALDDVATTWNMSAVGTDVLDHVKHVIAWCVDDETRRDA